MEMPGTGETELSRALFESLAGVALLSVGYYLMSDLVQFQLAGIFGALFTILAGTFLSSTLFIIGLCRGLKNQALALG